jgi:hypothetical protein
MNARLIAPPHDERMGLFGPVWRMTFEMVPETVDQVAHLDRVVEVRHESSLQKIGDRGVRHAVAAVI